MNIHTQTQSWLPPPSFDRLVAALDAPCHASPGTARPGALPGALQEFCGQAAATGASPEQMVRAFRRAWDCCTSTDHRGPTRALRYHETLSECLEMYFTLRDAPQRAPCDVAGGAITELARTG